MLEERTEQLRRAEQEIRQLRQRSMRLEERLTLQEDEPELAVATSTTTLLKQDSSEADVKKEKLPDVKKEKLTYVKNQKSTDVKKEKLPDVKKPVPEESFEESKENNISAASSSHNDSNAGYDSETEASKHPATENTA